MDNHYQNLSLALLSVLVTDNTFPVSCFGFGIFKFLSSFPFLFEILVWSLNICSYFPYLAHLVSFVTLSKLFSETALFSIEYLSASVIVVKPILFKNVMHAIILS